MSAPDRPRQRVGRAWIARAVLAVAVIGGLFAMHGLAGTGAVEMGHSGAVPSQAMASEDMVHALPADPDLGPSSVSMVPASSSDDGGSYANHPRKNLDVLNATFSCPDLDSFCLLDRLGLTVTGQQVHDDHAVLACRVLEPDGWCRECGSDARSLP